MTLNIGIHASYVCLEITAFFRAEMRDAVFRYLPQGKNALLTVGFDEVAPQDLCELSAGEAAGHIHLPEAILGSDVALGKYQVFQVLGTDVRDSVGVAI